MFRGADHANQHQLMFYILNSISQELTRTSISGEHCPGQVSQGQSPLVSSPCLTVSIQYSVSPQTPGLPGPAESSDSPPTTSKLSNKILLVLIANTR